MKLDLNAPITGKKKDVYPSKKTINLYYKEDKTTRPSTIALYALFFAVVLLAVSKVVIFDRMDELVKVQKQAEELQAHYDKQMEVLKEYKEISSQYSRYSFSYLREDEMLCDRLDVWNMLDETVFPYGVVNSMTITEDVVMVYFDDNNLAESADIVESIKKYDFVSSVNVTVATLDEKYTTRVMITLKSVGLGGEQ